MASNDKAAGEPLSSTFDVQQDGQQIRIVDSDGSIYEGAVLLAPQPIRARPVSEAQQKRESGLISGDQGQIVFKASGTNRSSRKLVLINGTLTAAGENQSKAEASKDAKSVETGFALERERVSPTPLQSRPEGFVAQTFDAIVRVDQTNETRVQATRVAR
jgi:hypothetical protein